MKKKKYQLTKEGGLILACGGKACTLRSALGGVDDCGTAAGGITLKPPGPWLPPWLAGAGTYDPVGVDTV